MTPTSYSQYGIGARWGAVNTADRTVDTVPMAPYARRGPWLGAPFAPVLEAARAGDGAAFSQLYRALAPAVSGYLRVQGAAEPDDLTNEVFLGAFTSLPTFEGDEDKFRSWVFTIAHHRLADSRRRQSRRPVVADGADVAEAGGHGGDVEDEAMRRLGVERVRALAARLSPDQRDVVLLRMVAGMTVEQVSESLGKPVTAVKALQRRAVASLRRSFVGEGVSR